MSKAKKKQPEMSRSAWASYCTGRALTVFLSVLHDKEGFTKEDMGRFWGEVLDLSESIVNGYVSYEDLGRVLKNECGVEVTGWGRKR